jgi:hypothetical protein
MDKKIEKVLIGMGETGDAPKGDYIETLCVRDGLLTRETAESPTPLGSVDAFGVIRIAAALSCGISKELLKELRSVFKIPPAASLLRGEMTRLISPPHGSAGLELAIDAGVMPHVLGVGVWESSRGERAEFMTLAENLEQARPEPEYRWALMFRRFNRKRMEAAIIALKFDKTTEVTLLKTLAYTDKLYFLNTKIEFKRFIKRCGFDDYYFIDRIARQERQIFDRRDLKVENRLYIIEEIKAKREPLAIEDLAIGDCELIENGLCVSKADCARILSSLLDAVIIKPMKNEPAILLREAARIKRNPLRVLINKVNWLR